MILGRYNHQPPFYREKLKSLYLILILSTTCIGGPGSDLVMVSKHPVLYVPFLLNFCSLWHCSTFEDIIMSIVSD